MRRVPFVCAGNPLSIWVKRMRRAAALALLALLCACPPGEAASWAYVTAFRSGAVYVVDVSGDRVIRAIPVEDHDGIIGLCVTSDGRRLVVVDGDERSRVRVFDALSGHLIKVAEFQKRRLRVEGPAVARLSSDDAWLFVETRGGTRVFDMRRGVFRARPLVFPGCRAPVVVGGGVRTLYAACGASVITFTPVQSKRADFMLKARGKVALAPLADAVAMRDGTRFLAVAQVPPMRKLPPPPPPPKARPVPSPKARPAPPSKVRPAPPQPSGAPMTGEGENEAQAGEGQPATPAIKPKTSPQPTPAPTPNPSLKEGPWRLSEWHPGAPHARVINLLKQVDLEKVSAAGMPRLAVSPDNRWIALVYARRAWIIHAETLLVQWEIYPPGIAEGAAFSADSQDLLTVLDGSLMRVRLANRSYRLLVPNQLRVTRAAVVVAGPAPTTSSP